MSVKLGAKFECNYTHEETLRSDPDVKIISSAGNVFGINRTVLACCSPVSQEFLTEHCCCPSCPLSNREDTVHITTDFGDSELQALMDFCFTGALPTTADKLLDTRFSGVFHTFGLDLNYLASPTATVVKTEPVEHVYEGPIGDYYGEDFPTFQVCTSLMTQLNVTSSKQKLENRSK